jgi:hypothetical protein
MLAQRQAKKELLGYFQDNWTDAMVNGLPNSTPVIAAMVFDNDGETYTPSVHYQNIEKRTKIPAGEHFALINILNLNSPQRSLPGGRANGEGVKFTTSGICIIRLFFSKGNYSTEEEDFLSAVAHEMFVGKSSENIWFRNATIKEMPAEETHFRSNIDFTYEFDTHVRCPTI